MFGEMYCGSSSKTRVSTAIRVLGPERKTGYTQIEMAYPTIGMSGAVANSPLVFIHSGKTNTVYVRAKTSPKQPNSAEQETTKSGQALWGGGGRRARGRRAGLCAQLLHRPDAAALGRAPIGDIGSAWDGDAHVRVPD